MVGMCDSATLHCSLPACHAVTVHTQRCLHCTLHTLLRTCELCLHLRCCCTVCTHLHSITRCHGVNDCASGPLTQPHAHATALPAATVIPPLPYYTLYTHTPIPFDYNYPRKLQNSQQRCSSVHRGGTFPLLRTATTRQLFVHRTHHCLCHVHHHVLLIRHTVPITS